MFTEFSHSVPVFVLQEDNLHQGSPERAVVILLSAHNPEQ